MDKSLLIIVLSVLWSITWGVFRDKIIVFFKAVYQNLIKKIHVVAGIDGTWQSVYIEGNKIRSELITINQEGSGISAIIKATKKQYNFKGNFINNILSGDYESTKGKAYERGGIFLKYISENILSGHCIFIYNNTEVYNSPYLWVKKKYFDITKGTYPFCIGCIGKTCCCASAKIDMPILLPHEVQSISIKNGQLEDTFCEKKSINLYQMKRNDEGACVFFKRNKCSIYAYRPIDCRLFPFDVKYIEGKYIIGYYPLACNELQNESDDTIKYCANFIRPLMAVLTPYLSESTDELLFKELATQKFHELEPLDNSL